MSDNIIKKYHELLNTSLISRERVRNSEDDHQMEFVQEIDGIAYINDSRSVSISSTLNSLRSVEASMILITGGPESEPDLRALKDEVLNKVAAIIYLGSNSDAVLRHYSSASLLFAKAADMTEAVSIAASYGRPGDVVIFSPGCLDATGSDPYKARGNKFKQTVRILSGK